MNCLCKTEKKKCPVFCYWVLCSINISQIQSISDTFQFDCTLPDFLVPGKEESVEISNQNVDLSYLLAVLSAFAYFDTLWPWKHDGKMWEIERFNNLKYYLIL